MSHPPHSKKHLTSSITALDQVSASQLLKALNTLQNIHLIQQQIDEDLNISFSQKDSFNNQGYQSIQQIPQSQKAKLRNPNQKSSFSKSPLPHQRKSSNISADSKMNFEFYMTKKQISNRSKSPRPSNQQNQFKKTFNNVHESTQSKKIIKTPLKLKKQNIQLNLALTQRSISQNRSFIQPDATNKKEQKQSNFNYRLKTQTNQIYKQKNYSKKTNNHEDLFNDPKDKNNKLKNKQNKIEAHLTLNQNIKKDLKCQPNQKQNFKLKENLNNQNSQSSNVKQKSNVLQHLSMHERTKQFIRQKNQKLAKLCLEIEQKRRLQQRQCTFKPAIISNNSNIKSKYQDLCASRQFPQKNHQRCKQSKGPSIYLETHLPCQSDFAKRIGQPHSNFTKSIKQYRHLNENQFIQSIQAETALRYPQYQRTTNSNAMGRTQDQVQKTKYKNTKFNVLLDMIH